MKKEIVDSLRWIYYSGRLLNYLENNSEDIEVKSVIDKFLRSEGFSDSNTFTPFNQGTVMMLLYGLFVYPREMWMKLEKDKLKINTYFNFDSRNTFKIDICPVINLQSRINEYYSLYKNKSNALIYWDKTNPPNNGNIVQINALDVFDFIRLLRNAIAHAHIEIDKENNSFVFSNYNQKGVVNFKVSNNKTGLAKFFNELSEFFINSYFNFT